MNKADMVAGNRDQHWAPDIRSFPGLSRLITPALFHCGGGIGVDSGCRFAFPAHNASYPNYHSQTCHRRGNPHSTASDYGIHFRTSEALQQAGAHGNHWSYVPYHPEAAGLREQWTGLLKTQLQYHLGGNTLQSRGKVLRRAESAPNQSPTCEAIFSDSQDSQVQESRGQKREWHQEL